MIGLGEKGGRRKIVREGAMGMHNAAGQHGG